MKRAVLIFLFLSLICVFGGNNANAAGLGFYGSFGAGTADWSPDSGLTYKKSTDHLGAGLALDTAPNSDRLFNYRLNIGYDQFRNRNSNAWGNADFDGFVISNNFGFGGLITPTTRLWFGPEVRVEWLDGSPKSYTSYKIRLMGVGFGPVVGVNFNYDDRHTFVVKAGYQLLHYLGEGEGGYSHSTNSAITTSTRYDYDVTEKLFYVTLEFLFRTSNDR
jgi:hypothetical protein